jgi:sulfur carrier protein
VPSLPARLEDVMSLTLILNGQPRNFTTLSQMSNLEHLVAELGLQGDRVAIEHNGTIVPRANWPQTLLAAGDRLEVVHFVGGGCGADRSVDRSVFSKTSH